MTHNLRRILPIVLLLAVLSAVVYYLAMLANPPQGPLQASGRVEATEILIAPETGGRIAQILVQEGQTVTAGDVLLRLQDDLLQAQRTRALAAQRAAETNLETARQNIRIAESGIQAAQARITAAQASLQAAQIQAQISRNSALAAYQPARTQSWKVTQPNDFTLPVWYFDTPETLAAAQAEIDAAAALLTAERASLTKVIADASNSDFAAAEQRLARAQAAFRVAQDVLDRAKVAQEKDNLEAYAQSAFDAAQSELNAAQTAYDQMLTDAKYADVLEARARVQVAYERLQTSYDRYNALLVGENALSVQTALANQKQAEANVALAEAALLQAQAQLAAAQNALPQAQAALEQVQAEIAVLDLQIAKLTLTAPESAVVLNRSVQVGEMLPPAGVALTLARLNDLTITVYVPEDRYGKIMLNQTAQVTVDSFPEQTFQATVTYIADKAEFTPRNVQTPDGRRTTVFAVRLRVTDPEGLLKPGMPADVVFN